MKPAKCEKEKWLMSRAKVYGRLSMALLNIFWKRSSRTLSGNLLTVDFYCNEEFAVIDDEKFEKLNALASLISGQEIRENVAVVVYAGGRATAFTFSQYIANY